MSALLQYTYSSVSIVSMIPIRNLTKLTEFILFFPEFNEDIVREEIGNAALSFKGLNNISLDMSCFDINNYDGDGYYQGCFFIYV